MCGPAGAGGPGAGAAVSVSMEGGREGAKSAPPERLNDEDQDGTLATVVSRAVA